MAHAKTPRPKDKGDGSIDLKENLASWGLERSERELKIFLKNKKWHDRITKQPTGNRSIFFVLFVLFVVPTAVPLSIRCWTFRYCLLVAATPGWELGIRNRE